MSPAVLDRVIERTAGAAAAFIKELARRCVLDGLARRSTMDESLPRALDEMLEHARPVLRSSLGTTSDAASRQEA